METKDGFPTFYAATITDWRNWLSENVHSAGSVWLIIYKKASGKPSITYSEAVDEALCFGWIDSKPNKRDEKSYYQFFSKRNPKSNWSRVNKENVARLIKENRMSEEGFRMIEIARKTGTWNALDAVENGDIPEDLQALFDQNTQAWEYWKDFPRSAKRNILEWIFNAKRPATREKRIRETVKLAAQNIRANQYRP